MNFYKDYLKISCSNFSVAILLLQKVEEHLNEDQKDLLVYLEKELKKSKELCKNLDSKELDSDL